MKAKRLLFLLICISLNASASSVKDDKPGDSDSVAHYRNELKETLRLSQQAGVTMYHSYLYLMLGISQFEENKPDSAIYYLRNSLLPYQKNPKIADDDIRKQAFVFLTHSYKALGRHDSAVVYGRRLIELASAMKDSSTVANYRYTVAATYCDMNRVAEGLEYYQSAGEMAAKIGDRDLAFTSYKAAANIYDTSGHSVKALPLMHRAMSYAEETGNSSNRADGLASLAAIYYNLKKYDKAEEYYRKALDCYTAVHDKQNSSLVQRALTDVLSRAGQQQAAWDNMNAPEAKGDVEVCADSLSIPGLYGDLKLKLLTATVNAEDKKVKYSVLYQQYLEREAIALRQRMWLVSLLSGLAILVLLLLYNRQRQKTKAETTARRLEEKENEYLSLQNESEQRQIRKYIDGLESERERISKELHDGVCNDLLGLEMELKRTLGSHRELEKQMVFLTRTRENIRSVSHALMPPLFQYATLDEMVSDYATHLNLPTSTTIAYSQTEEVQWDDIPKEIGLEAYRITQEALSNSIKHAHASKIDVSLTRKGNLLALIIRDNGTGFDRNRKRNGIGIHTITERAKSVGGTLHIETGAGGTVIEASFVI